MEALIEVESSVKFSPAEREAVLEVLEECADSLAVYHNTLRQQPVMEGEVANFYPEVDISETSVLQSLIGNVAEMTDSRKKAVREKLQRDSLYVSGIMRDLKQEISERGTIEVLIKEIERITSQEEKDRFLSEQNEKMQTIITELRKTMVDKKTSNEKEEESLTTKFTLTRDEKEKLKLIKDVEMRYVQTWETARRGQNVLRYKLKMDQLEKTLNNYYVREKNENYVNTELTRYLTWRIAFIENRIEQWQRRYEQEQKMYEKEICKVRNEIEDAQKYLEQLTTEHCSNQEFIDTYLAEQEALRRQKEHEDHVQRCTIRIQAWWRGVMVRRKLGPYRPEEKKKKRPVKTKK
ncbi:dynein regulatory complex protein 9 [Nylanderia fulva]|uniref:dynein regulatory complex protein 9 n=1 Tax=Nylanderia fulva TaxID=613905 RepID=UPI0010FB8F08|nr:dynein regulatory complex protein 9 [Nylanderia fulva]